MAEVPLPSRIGRYEIAGLLARGGMAEVLLGRLRGPHGFDRPVVIKRILPHLTAQPGIVDMFLAEARTIANIRHPNLIPIHELALDRNELFMVMEYLEGESISGLCRRLAARAEFLDFALAAHVIAEACAGLHAAHDAVGPDKKPLEIVHRDVSPQNLFISYSGAVTVIDFGIARNVTEQGHTQDGSVRGKVEYFAPEQLMSEGPLDRRVDIFALGIVLFELASGRRLYKRNKPQESLLAIVKEPAPALRMLKPNAPLELEEICARALSKDPKDRFQTAAEMRRALLGFARRFAGDEDLDDKLAKTMQRLFADRAAEKAAMLERARSSNTAFALPATEADETIELPSAHAEITQTSVTALALAKTVVASSGPGMLDPTVPTLESARDVPSNAQPQKPPQPPPTAQKRRGTPLVWAAMIVVAAIAPVAIYMSAKKAKAPSAQAAEPPPVSVTAPAAPTPVVSVAQAASLSPAPPIVSASAGASAAKTATKPPVRPHTHGTQASPPVPTIW